MIRTVVLLNLILVSTLSSQDRPTVAVFPFESKSSGSKELWMMYGLSNLISESLIASETVNAVPLDKIHQARIDADIYPQSLFDGKITPAFVKYNLEWNSGHALLGQYELAGDSVRLSFRVCLLGRKAFTPAETITGTYTQFTDFYRMFNLLMEAIYAQLILQTDLTIPREAILKSHARSREMVADLDGYRSYIRSWMTLSHYDAAMERLNAAKYDEAVRYFMLAEATDEAHTLNISAGLSDAYVRRGNVLFEQKKLDEAREDYEKALAVNPVHGAAFYNLGNVFKEQAQWDKAVELYRKSTEVDAGNFEAWINTGFVCMAQGKYGEAIGAYNKALALKDSNAQAHFYAGVAYDHQGDSIQARREYEKAIAIDPTLADAHLNLGILLRRQNDLNGARMRYLSALTYAPHSAPAHRNLGILMMKNKKETTQALLHLERTLELEPNQPDADVIRKNIETLKKRIRKK